MLTQDKILNFLKVIGPTLPSKVAKNIGTNILIASAYLSDLASQSKVRISHLKVGGSPLYYLPGQENQLLNFASDNLNPKDYQVLLRLKADKILRESSLDLLSKVVLRSLQDFAVPLHVTTSGQKELFWKWYLSPEEETNTRISTILFGSYPQPAEAEKSPAYGRVGSPGITESPQQKLVVTEEKLVSKQEGGRKTGEKRWGKEDEKKRVDIQLVDKESRKIPEEAGTAKKEKKIKDKHKEPTEPEAFSRHEEPKSKEKKVLPKIKDQAGMKKSSVPDAFFPVLEEFFQERKIAVLEQEVIRKNSEINLLVAVPSIVGSLTYFCKAKNKSRCDEKDLSAAYMEARIKKLPLLFLYANELTKKSQEMLDSGAFENAVVKKIE